MSGEVHRIAVASLVLVNAWLLGEAASYFLKHPLDLRYVAAITAVATLAAWGYDRLSPVRQNLALAGVFGSMASIAGSLLVWLLTLFVLLVRDPFFNRADSSTLLGFSGCGAFLTALTAYCWVNCARMLRSARAERRRSAGDAADHPHSSQTAL